ncbi:MAG: UDP-N-acetylmuramoyl-tripeptide--D-alanyl-D-alanine ligase, partial [Alphaproteobacteria bacterium MarineAlpha5_Bin5]
MISKNIINSYILKNNNKIKINSKDIKKNDIFLALQGSKYHGNRFISDSIKRGAKYCITDKIPRGKRNINNLLIVESVFMYLIDLSKIKRSLFKGKVIGITGSAGKTTLKETLFFFLNKKYKTSASIKSYNNILGVLITILNLDINSKYAIFELGTNNFGEIRNLVSLVKPSQIFITNIQPTHLETFKSKKNI